MSRDHLPCAPVTNGSCRSDPVSHILVLIIPPLHPCCLHLSRQKTAGLHGCSVSSIVLRGATEGMLDDVERAVDDGINAFKVCAMLAFSQVHGCSSHVVGVGV